MQKIVTQGFRLSPQQQHVWWAQRTERSSAFVVQARIDINGTLDRQRLVRALEKAVGRHEILRTTFPLLPGLSVPVQAVEGSAGIDWSECNLAGLLAAERKATLDLLGAEIRDLPFDLANGPLLRAILIALETAPEVDLEGERHALLLSQPALAADGTSLDLLAAEVAAAYCGALAESEVFQYADLAELLHEWQDSPAGEPGPTFWREQDLSALALVTLSGSGLPDGQPFRPEHVRQEIERAPVETAAARLGTTVSLVLLAGWHAALHLATGGEEIVVGTLFDGRTCAELETALGPFARYLPVRGRSTADSTLADLARIFSAAMADIARRQDFFSSTSIEQLLTGNEASGWPFGFDFRPLPELPAAPEAPKFAIGDAYLALDRFGLRLSLLDGGRSLRADLFYDPALSSCGETERLLERFSRVLNGLLAGSPLGEIDVLSEAERRQVLLELNRTESAATAELCAHHLFEERVRLAPLAPALVHTGRTWTYAELNARSNRLAHCLRASGLGPGSLAGVCLERSPELVAAVLGILKAGAAYVPLDPGYPADRLSWMAEDARLSLLLTEERFRPLFTEAPIRTLRLAELMDSYGEVARQSEQDPPLSASPADLAYVIYTSGSTGRPKGVMIPHRGLANYLLWARQAYAANDGNGAPVHSAIGFDLTVTSLFVPLTAGRPVELLPEEQGVGALAAALRDRRGFSLVKLTPAHLEVLRQVLTPEEISDCARTLVIGGEALRAETIEMFRQGAPGTQLFNEYGPTEATVGCCVYEIGPEAPTTGAVPIGRPIANTRLYVMGPRLRPLPAGAPGELWIGGEGLARGYLKRPDLTAERFVPDPFGPSGGRLYRTGDRVRLRPDGHLEFLGRLDDQVKIRGHRVEPGEVEAALAAHPAVGEVAVAARGEGGERRLVAWFTPCGATAPTPGELRTFLGRQLPEPLVPSAFVPLDALPLTVHGKVDRRSLPEPQDADLRQVSYAPPRNLTEELLAEIFGRVLGVEQVGIDDSFFTLGGDSIRSVQVIPLAQKRGITLRVQDLFSHPTIRGLAGLASLGGAIPELEPDPAPFALISAEDRARLDPGIEDAYPVSQLQAGMLFHTERDPQSAVYHVQHSFRMNGRFDPEPMQWAIDRIVRRHPILRTSFDLGSFSEPLQLVHGQVAAPLGIDDLRALDPDAQREAVPSWLAASRHRPFDWMRPPLARFHVHLLDADSFVFTLSLHHAVLDGWSVAVLLSELFHVYLPLLQGNAPPEERPLTASFREFIRLERSLLSSPAAAEFWDHYLEDAELTTLPRLGTGRTGAIGIAGVTVLLSPDISEGLHRLARTAVVPLKSVVLAAHLRALSLLGGHRDVTTGLVSHARPERQDGERVLGMFLNTLPLRLNVAGGTWLELAQAAFGAESTMLPFRAFPLPELQRRQGGRPPFEAVFNFLHFHVYRSVMGIDSLAARGIIDYEEINYPFLATFSLALAPGSTRVELHLAYHVAEFGAAEVEQIGGRYRAILEAMVTAPEARYETVSLLTAAERHQLLAEWSDTAAEVTGESILTPIEEQVGRTPDAVAVVCEAESLTYAELSAAANRVANRLHSLGVGSESLVGVVMERSCALVVALLATVKAGGAYVPLDPEAPRERLATILADCGARVLLTQERLATTLPRVQARILCLDDLKADLGAESAEPPRIAIYGTNAVYMIYTSGSTGRPKGAVNTHRALLNHLHWMQSTYGLTSDDRVLQKTPFSFDVSVWELFWPLVIGARLVTTRPGGHRDPAYLAGLIAREGVTALHFVPSMLQLFLEEPDVTGCQSLRLVFASGEVLPYELQQRFYQRLACSSVELHNLYGPTEAAIDVTSWRCPRQSESTRVSIGRPVANTSIRILGPWLQPVALGVPGELCIGGVQLARGYFGHPELTADRFIPDPVSEDAGERLYRTGDLARYLLDGALDYLGRLDFQVKIRGVRIELGEIEAILSSLAGVSQAVVIVREDLPGELRLVAYVVGDIAADALRQTLRERLPDSMVPVAFVTLSALPLTLNGKVDRRALPAPEWQSAEESYLAPRTLVEEVLAGIWAELLGLERVGAADHFFDLGGHSLLAMRVISRLRSTFGIEMPLRDLFEAPTLADLAARVELALRAGAGRLTPPLVPVPREGPVSLSFAQQRLWFIDQLEPGLPLYNVPIALRVEGPLNSAVLALCLGEIVRRHETLRTVFAMLEGSPVQVIRPVAPFDLAVIDLSGLPEREREALALALASEETVRSFDLTRGPLLRGMLLRLTDGDHIATLTMHHIVSDGWSMGILVREATALYAAFAKGRPSPLPELPVQYADFSAWQRSWLHGEFLDREISFWRQQLAGLPPRLELPTDRPRPAVQSFRGASRRMLLPADFTHQAQVSSRRAGATLFMVLLAGFQTLLARYSGQQDLAVGTPVAGRNRMEIEGLIGFFVNTLVLRGDLTGAPSFGRLLNRTREIALAAHTHQDLPFEKLVQELSPERSLAQTPLFQVMFVLQNVPVESLEIRNLRLRQVGGAGRTAKFDLTISLAEHGDELSGTVEHSTDLFDGTTIERLIGHFERLLATASAAPELPVAELPLLSGAEQGQILVEWNDTRSARVSRACVHELFAAQSRRTPDAIAVVFGTARLTYAELDARANRLAQRLRRLGVGPDVLVGLLVERSPDMVVGVLGILQAGAAYAPLDPGYPEQRLALMLEDTRSPVVLTQKHLRDRLPAGGSEVVVLDEEYRPGAIRGPLTAGESLEGSLAYVTFTSGSTGRPKGVALSHGALCNLIDWHLATCLGGVPTLQFASLSFDVSFYEMFACWCSGGTLIVVPEELRRDMPALAGLLVEQRIEKAILPVVVFQELAELFAGCEKLPPLREITTTGERLQTNRAMASMLRRLPGCAFHNHYGPSETHVATACTLSPDPEHWAVYPSIGRPLWNCSAYVLELGMAPAPVGVPGDLCIGGACLARGYLGRPDLTAQKFVPDPFGGKPGGRLYRTGDKVRISTSGDLEFLGRFDDQVKIRGFRIEPGEVEAALVALSGVREVVVVAREDTPGDRRLVAYMVGDVAAEELRQSLRERLPDSMVPATFVKLAALPLTPNRKVDRKALPAPEWQQVEESYLAPRTPVEEVLAGIWAELLGLERVGAGDHFFDLGGHSLLATRVMSRLRAAFGIEMPLREVFEAPTLANLAARVENARKAGAGRLAPPLVPVPREGFLPLSFAQQRLWFLDQLEPGRPVYNLPVALRIEGPLNSEVLALCLGEIVRRHEVLRTVFAAREDSPTQVIQSAAPFVLPMVDLSSLPERQREALALTLVGEEAGRPFDLTCDPLLRSVLLRLEGDDHVAALTMHHIASDGWSMGLLVREVTSLYAAFAEGRPSPLPGLPIQYVDFAVWQHSWLHGETLEGEISFWRRQLADLPPLLELTTDRPRPVVQSFRGDSRPVQLSAALTRQVQAIGRREGATLFMVLLAGFQALLARYSGQNDFAVGTPVAGRNRVEIEGLIGFFVNTLVLRGDSTGEPSIRELLRRVRETALAAHTHQDVPFEKLVQELSPERSLAHTPVFQVMFALQNTSLESLAIKNLCLRPLAVAGTTAKFDLTLSFKEWNDGLSGAIVYATNLFDAATVDRLIVHYKRLLTSALRSPEKRLSELSLLTQAEHHQLALEWNNTVRSFGAPTCLHHLIVLHVNRVPEAEAVVCEGRSLTFDELGRRAAGLAFHLNKMGIGPEIPVVLFLDRSVETIVALLGVLMAGGCYVPVDPTYPAERVAWLLKDSQASVVVTSSELAGRLPAGVQTLLVEELAERAEIFDGDVDTDHPAYVLYTSGSTGRPKGVVVRHGSVMNLARALHERVYQDVAGPLRVGVNASFSFDGSVKQIVQLALGHSLHILPQDLRLDPAALVDIIRRQRLDVLDCTPSQLRLLLQAGLGEEDAAPTIVLVGGEAVDADLRDAALARTGTRFWNVYGPTECTVDTAATPFAAGTPHSCIGLPLPNVQIYVIAGTGGLAPVGVPGELQVGGAGLARGYLRRPDLTAERFVPDPLSSDSGSRLYRTGDLVRRLPNGSLDFLGRLDHQVKVRGFRIELGEIESVLVALAGVHEAVVVAREDMPGDRRLVAYIVGDVPAEALRQSLREWLPDYMVPAAFITVESLPLTINGKVDRQALPAPQWQRTEQKHLAPRTPVEEVLAGIWAELLGLEGVGPADHFFELGGHSLLATRVMSRLRSAFDVEMPLRDLFEAPRLADLATRVEAARRAGVGQCVPPPVPIPREGDLPLSFAQQRLWFLDQLLPGDPAYSLPAALCVVGALDREALAKAFSVLVARHEVLRTIFGVRDGEPVQRIAPAAISIPFNDLAGLPRDRTEAEVHRLAAEEARRPFDLARGPLLRFTLVQLGHREHALLLNLHHIVADAWSMGLLIRELTALYASFLEGTTALLPALPVQYADYAIWQRSWLRGEILEAQLAWWRRELAGASTSLDLSFDRLRPAISSHRGGSVGLALSAELTAELDALSQRNGTTLFMTLLAGWSSLLSRYAAQEDVLVGSPIANRTRLETENLIGFFVNTLVLRTDLSGRPGFGELMARVRRATLGAYDHQDLPFERLVEELVPERSLNRSPLFQVMFGLQNAPVETIEMAGLELRPLQVENKTAKFDLSLSLIETGGRLHAGLVYSTDLFDRATAERLLGHFSVLLTGALADPAARHGDLPLLSAAEREQLAREAEASRRTAPDVELAVPGLFAEVAERIPEAVAILGAGEELLFGELRQWSSRLAGLLRRERIGLERRVAVCAEPSAALVAGVLAVLAAGGVWVPLDPAYPDERLARILTDSGASLALVQDRLADRFAGIGTRILRLGTSRTFEGDPEAPRATAAPVPLEAAAYVTYTSGTTGRPKGTVVSHRSLAGYIAWFNGHFSATGTLPIPCVSSPGFDASLKQLLAPLLRGEAVWIVPPGTASRPDDLLAEIAARGRAALNCVPSLWRVLLERIEAGRDMKGALRRLLLGGEALAPSLVEKTLATLPGLEIWNLYGPTEATANASCARVVFGRADIGRGVAGAALHVVDRHLQLMPSGVPGELAIAGSGLARGYLGLPGVTAEQFAPNPFAIGPGERLYLTGDRARVLPDGAIELLGRLDRQVKIRGFRLEPSEVETALCRLPSVAQAFVAAWESPSEDRRLAAWIVPTEGAVPDPAELRTNLLAVLAEPMVPTAWTVLPSMPLTPNGKVDRAALPRPDCPAAAVATYEEPRTAIQRKIAEIWRDLLGTDRVGLHDNFFDLGGHSLLVMRVQSRLRDQLGREVSMVDLFSHTTVSSLARLLADAEGTEPTPVRSEGQQKRMVSSKERLRRLRRDMSTDRRAR